MRYLIYQDRTTFCTVYPCSALKENLSVMYKINSIRTIHMVSFISTNINLQSYLCKPFIHHCTICINMYYRIVGVCNYKSLHIRLSFIKSLCNQNSIEIINSVEHITLKLIYMHPRTKLGYAYSITLCCIKTKWTISIRNLHKCTQAYLGKRESKKNDATLNTQNIEIKPVVTPISYTHHGKKDTVLKSTFLTLTKLH